MESKKEASKINLLVIGTGMYVCGRGTDGFGTILPAIMQAYKAGIIDKILISSKNGNSFKYFDEKLHHLENALGIKIEYTRYPPEESANPVSYLDAIKNLPDPGAVIIATPDHMHFDMAIAAIEHGKHILVVKPLCHKFADADLLSKAARLKGVYGAVEFHKRWDWANLKLLSALEQGKIGDPLYFHIEYSQRKIIPTEFFSSWVNNTNIFQYLGVHYVDIIYFVTHDIPKRLIAIGQQKWLPKQGIPTFDAIQVVIEWSSGFVSTILTNWIDPNCNSAMSQQMIKVIGTKGRFESDQTNRGVRIVSDSLGVEDINPYFCQPYANIDYQNMEYKGYGIDSITQFLKDVKEIANGSRSPADFEGIRPTFNDVLVSTAVIEGARLSLENGNNWVYFDKKLAPHL